MRDEACAKEYTGLADLPANARAAMLADINSLFQQDQTGGPDSGGNRAQGEEPETKR